MPSTDFTSADRSNWFICLLPYCTYVITAYACANPYRMNYRRNIILIYNGQYSVCDVRGKRRDPCAFFRRDSPKTAARFHAIPSRPSIIVIIRNTDDRSTKSLKTIIIKFAYRKSAGRRGRGYRRRCPSKPILLIVRSRS